MKKNINKKTNKNDKMPTALKVVFALSLLWILGSIFALSGRLELGIPFFGFYLYGFSAGLVVYLLDIIGPIAFLIGLWNKKTWAVPVAYTYLIIFILNSIVALFTLRDKFTTGQILIPALVYFIFLATICKNKKYFNK